MYTPYDENEKLWGSLDVNESIKAEKSIGQHILDELAKHDSKIAQINDVTGVQMTFREVKTKTIRAAQNLLKRGYEPRQVIGFMADNSDNLLPIFLATICLGCPIVPLNISLSKDEIVRVFSKTKPTLLFCDAKSCVQMTEALRELNWDLEIFTLDEKIDNFDSVESLLVGTGDEDDFVPVCLDMENDIAGFFSSSGTTGPSKCVCVSYSHTVYSEPRLLEGAAVTVVSIYWTVGIKVIMDCIHSGVPRIIIDKEFTPRYFAEIIEKYKVAVLLVSPYRVVSLIKSDDIDDIDLSNVTEIYYYGNEMPLSLVGEVKRYFPNAEQVSAYGLTEIGKISKYSLGEVFTGHRLYDGLMVVKIVDDYGSRCGPNVNGEICVMKGYKFLGYFQDSAATAAAVDDEGFFRTGDIGHFDDSGAMFIEDRKKNILQVFHFGGFILPTEIEEVLISLPDVKEACVVGIPILELSGHMIPAAVIARKTNSNINQNDIFNLVAERFPDRAKLRGGIYFIDSLPKTHNGKMIRGGIAKIAARKFKLAKEVDSNVQKYLLDYPEKIRELI